MILTEKEKELIIFGLQMRKNYIETGEAHYDANDAWKMGKQIKSLSIDQMELCISIHNLILKIENGEG